MTDDLDDEQDDDEQWTPQARARYTAAHAELLTALEAHYAHVIARDGRGSEMATSVPSAQGLEEALSAFADAEFDWCGSSPFLLEGEDDDEDDELYAPAEESMVTVEYRGELEVLDQAALVEAGRAAYRRLWPADPPVHAQERVTDAVSAIGELWHADGIAGVLSTSHLLEVQMEMNVHPGTARGADAPRRLER